MTAVICWSMKMRMVAKIAKIGAKKRSTHLNENILNEDLIPSSLEQKINLTFNYSVKMWIGLFVIQFSMENWKFTVEITHCGNYGILLSHIFDRNSVKATFLLKNLLNHSVEKYRKTRSRRIFFRQITLQNSWNLTYRNGCISTLRWLLWIKWM